jgi:hypothetical protein
MLGGELAYTNGDERTELGAGDVLFVEVSRPTRFEVGARGDAEYLVIQEPA